MTLTPGIIQEPLILLYYGVLHGWFLSVSGSLLYQHLSEVENADRPFLHLTLDMLVLLTKLRHPS